MTDIHAHYDDPAFDGDRDEAVKKALSAARVIINAGISVQRSESSIALAGRYDGVYAAVGIHPQYDGDIALIEGLCRKDKVIAVGEIGLDYRNAGASEKARQRELFTAQLDIAREYNLPVVIHCVDAWGDMTDILRHTRARGVMHGFTGSAETAAELVRLGMYISFGGRVTYPAAKRAVRALSAVPDERLLIETDAPYAPPYPHHDMRCEGYMLSDTAEHIAGIRGISSAELSAITDNNAHDLFGV